MKPNFAGALAFVIWYFLITPPVEHGLTDAVDKNAPLARWTTEYRYDTLNKCEAAAKDLKMLVPMGPEEVPYAKCVASDDPRLE